GTVVSGCAETVASSTSQRVRVSLIGSSNRHRSCLPSVKRIEPRWLMSAWGHPRRSRFGRESACPPIPDIDVPLADISAPLFAERDLWNIRPHSLRLDFGSPEDFAPLLGFVGDQPTEVGR